MSLIKKYFSDYNNPGGIRELLLLALPMIISTACDGVMTFTDRLFLARVGSEQMNAALGGGVTMQMLMFFFMGLIGYSTALVAQYFGAGEKHNSAISAFQAILVTILAWTVVLLLKPLIYLYFEFMKIPETQIAYQVEYLNILAIGSIFSMLRYTLGCYFTGIGKTKVVMTATMVAMVVNVILDYILIFGKLGFPAMGVAGAALATVAGGFCAMVILIVAYFGLTNRLEFGISESFRYDWKIMKKLIYYGSPAGAEMFLNFLAFATVVSLFHAQGEVVATASTIMFNWDMVSFIPLVGIEIAITSLVGRYMGAEQPEIAHYSAISAVKTGILYSVIILCVFLLFPEGLVRVFHPDSQSAVFEEAVPIAVSMVRLASLYVLVEAVMVALIGTLRGAGDTHFTMIVSVSVHWLIVPMLYLALNVFHFSVLVSWFLLIIFYLVFSLLIILRFLRGKWKSIRVIQN
jgi:multidrug resistance protein, MATE family